MMMIKNVLVKTLNALAKIMGSENVHAKYAIRDKRLVNLQKTRLLKRPAERTQTRNRVFGPFVNFSY